MKRGAIILLLLVSLAFAQQFPSPTDKYVNDFVSFFSASEKTELRSLLIYVEQNSTAEVTIAVVQTVAPLTPAEYATGLASQWGVGKSDVDNGLLILYAVSEKKIYVAVGYGLEGVLPDSKIGRMLDDYYVPLRDANLTSAGIINFTSAAAVVLENNSAEIRSGAAGQSGTTDIMVIFIIATVVAFGVFAVILMVFAARYQRKFGKGGKLFGGGGFGGGFGGGGFGGGGFGGGGFGGGGAGR
jgi:uncharacterized protein